MAIGREIIRVQEVFGKIFNAGTEFQRDGSQFDQLFQDGDRFKIGTSTPRSCMCPAIPRPALPMSSATRCSRRHAVHADFRHGAL